MEYRTQPTPPERSPDQIARAAEKALAVRRARAELKKDLKAGTLTLEDVFEGEIQLAEKMRVAQILEALPGVGKATAADIIDELGISPTRRVRGLGHLQKRALLQRFGFTTRI